MTSEDLYWGFPLLIALCFLGMIACATPKTPRWNTLSRSFLLLATTLLGSLLCRLAIGLWTGHW